MESWRPWLLLAASSAPVVLLGSVFLGLKGAAAGASIFLAFSVILYWLSAEMVLKVTGAAPAGKDEVPHLYSVLRSVSTWAEIPAPTLYVVDVREPNAFVVGPTSRRAAIVLTRGLLEVLAPDELKGVIAHKVAHIKHGDIGWSSFAAALMAIIPLIRKATGRTMQGGRRRSTSALMAMVAPLVKLSSSQKQEYRADKAVAQITGTTEGLARALGKLSATFRPGHVADEVLPLYVAQPLWLHRQMNPFHPRPEISDRITRLRMPG